MLTLELPDIRPLCMTEYRKSGKIRIMNLLYGRIPDILTDIRPDTRYKIFQKSGPFLIHKVLSRYYNYSTCSKYSLCGQTTSLSQYRARDRGVNGPALRGREDGRRGD